MPTEQGASSSTLQFKVLVALSSDSTTKPSIDHFWWNDNTMMDVSLSNPRMQIFSCMDLSGEINVKTFTNTTPGLSCSKLSKARMIFSEYELLDTVFFCIYFKGPWGGLPLPKAK